MIFSNLTSSTLLTGPCQLNGPCKRWIWWWANQFQPTNEQVKCQCFALNFDKPIVFHLQRSVLVCNCGFYIYWNIFWILHLVFLHKRNCPYCIDSHFQPLNLMIFQTWVDCKMLWFSSLFTMYTVVCHSVEF